MQQNTLWDRKHIYEHQTNKNEELLHDDFALTLHHSLLYMSELETTRLSTIILYFPFQVKDRTICL